MLLLVLVLLVLLVLLMSPPSPCCVFLLLGVVVGGIFAPGVLVVACTSSHNIFSVWLVCVCMGLSI
jgi:hypothetical protein